MLPVEGEQEAAFTEVKTLIESAGILTHYDPNKEMVITCDAFPKGSALPCHA